MKEIDTLLSGKKEKSDFMETWHKMKAMTAVEMPEQQKAMMREIEAMLSGEMEMADFVAVLCADPKVQDALNSLIPEDAKYNEKHDIWKKFSYHALKDYRFDLCAYIWSRHRYDGTIEKALNIFGVVSHFYSYWSPNFVCTSKYYDAHALYLHAIGDCFEGPEVQVVVDSIVEAALKIQGKGKRKAYAKSEIQRQFHVTDNKRPYWIQGPEWPMGVHSPMKFVERKRKGELVLYFFEDVDTGAVRIVEQYY